MIPATLTTAGLTLDLPTPDDVDRTAEYCQDPIFEQFLTTPWPYTRDDALGFLVDIVPGAWKRGTEFTWAIRHEGEFMGLISYRPVSHDVGFWLGRPHRGHGYMTEATSGVLDWAFENRYDDILWECIVGNVASVAVARKCGFTYTGEGPSHVVSRDGSHPPSWHALIRSTDSRDPKPGWPA